MTKISSLLIILVVFITSCSKKPVEFREGTWRATLKTSTGAEIPFNFQVLDSAGKKRIEIINGKDRFRVNEINTQGDSVNIRMPLFDSEIKSVIGENGYLYGK